MFSFSISAKEKKVCKDHRHFALVRDISNPPAFLQLKHNTIKRCTIITDYKKGFYITKFIENHKVLNNCLISITINT